jgi:SAM-dependent methyltransferase
MYIAPNIGILKFALRRLAFFLQASSSMTEFWESAFQKNTEMWGWEPASSAIAASELFKKHQLEKILIPGIGYGRNAEVFRSNGCAVTGIEISETAIALARKRFGHDITLHHGSVSLMPFDTETYDGIFSYSLLHLLGPNERSKLIEDCYKQLRPGGFMVFVSISKEDFRYGQGEETCKDTFDMPYGVTLFFYDSNSIASDFGKYDLMESTLIGEPMQDANSSNKQGFWYIVCRKAIN